MSEIPPKFVADVMLGKLARWLRLFGCDVHYDNTAEDAKLLAIALSEKRILLTRDRQLSIRAGKYGYLVQTEGTNKQIAEIVEKFDVEPVFYGDICPECNGKVVPVSKESVQEDIPQYTYRTHNAFRRCLSCGKVYWEGSHRELAENDLERILNDEDK